MADRIHEALVLLVDQKDSVIAEREKEIKQLRERCWNLALEIQNADMRSQMADSVKDQLFAIGRGHDEEPMWDGRDYSYNNEFKEYQ